MKIQHYLFLTLVLATNFSTECMLSFITYKLNYIDTKNSDHLTLAAEQNDLKTLDLFIKAKSNLNKPNAIGDTALHCACSCGNYQFALKLLEAGASVEVTDNDGNTPLHDTLLARNSTTAKSIRIVKDVDDFLYHEYYLADDLEKEDKYFLIIQLLIKYGANIYKPFSNAYSYVFKENAVVRPLEYVAEYGFKDLVKLFLFLDVDKKGSKDFMKDNHNCGFVRCERGEIPKILNASSIDEFLTEKQKIIFPRILNKRTQMIEQILLNEIFVEPLESGGLENITFEKKKNVWNLEQNNSN